MKNKKAVSVVFTTEELERLHAFVSFSNCKERAEYIRRAALRKPIKFSYRNESFDDFINECIRLRNDLKEIMCLPLDQPVQQQLASTCEAIKLTIYKLYDQCKPS